MPGASTILRPPTREGTTGKTISRRNFLFGSAAVSGFVLYSGEVARHEIDVVERTIAIQRLPLAFHGYRIVQISDLHLDEYTEPGFLKRVIRHVNALSPELVLITGDFISKGPFPASYALERAVECGELLRAIACPLRYGVLGNHDVDVGGPEVRSILASCGFPILNNQYVAVEKGGKRLWIAGLDDPSQGAPDIELAVPYRPDGPVILMAHEPDYADEIATHGRSRFIDLILSGHSHGGQIRFPFIPPTNLPPMAEKYYEGNYRVGDMQLYVNRGIGTVGLPFRLFCPPEITVFTLQPHGLI